MKIKDISITAVKNGLYILTPIFDPTVALTLTQRVGDDEYYLTFQTKDPKNDNQKFYFKRKKETIDYSLISFARSNCIGVKHDHYEDGSEVVECELNFKDRCLWNMWSCEVSFEKEEKSASCLWTFLLENSGI